MMQDDFSIDFLSLAYSQPYNYDRGDKGPLNEVLWL